MTRGVKMRVAMVKRSLRTLKNLPKLAVAKYIYKQKFHVYQTSGQPPADAERVLLLANWATGGSFPKEFSRRNTVPFESAGLQGFSNKIFTGFDAMRAAQGLERAGYYVAPKTIDHDLVSELSSFLSAGPAEPRDFLGPAPMDKKPNERATTWWMTPDVIVQCPAFRKLLAESYPPGVAGKYFRGSPMIMSIAMWKSFPSASGQSASAQQFHYDGDRPLFLKMFVYLEDVTPSNGPHVYVPNTHGRKPKWLMQGDRLSDAEIDRKYPKETWAQICGPKGTVFFADTQGIHKGMNVISGSRSMLQINFASDRFGPVYPTIGGAEDAPADIQEFVKANPRYFAELYTPSPSGELR